jgi:hypothetical protein
MRAASYPVRYWNWKAASLQIAIRATAYFIVATRHLHAVGHQAGFHAAVVEAAYVCLTAGFYSALQQGAMRVEPRWLANLVIIGGVPMLAQAVDTLVQQAAGTPNLKAVSLGMVFWGLLSAAFHLHLMRNGAMLVGKGEGSFANDLRRIPRLVGSFVATPVVGTLKALRPRIQTGESEAVA